jgi:hypothetical protein
MRWLALFLCSCAAVTPMQTASVVPTGQIRVGGQLSTAGFCGELAVGVLGLTRCTEYPDGIPLPELRGGARLGVAPGVDVGGSIQLASQVLAVDRSLQLGFTADVKAQIIRVSSGPLTHVVSAGLLGGAASSFRFGLSPWWQAELGVPLFYGIQLSDVELVAAVTMSQRITVQASEVLPPTSTTRLGLSLGVYRRNPTSWGLQLNYLTDPSRFAGGAIQLQFGWFWDITPT